MNDTKQALTIPLALPRRADAPEKGITVLAGDIGGTKTNLAFYKATPDSMELVYNARYPSADFSTLQEIIQRFLVEAKQPTPDRISLGVAGPVLNGKVELTNLSWTLDAEAMQQQLGVGKVSLINDLEATAYGLAGLTSTDFITIHQGRGGNPGNMAIIAPGTGLGEAGLFWNGKTYHPFPTEGGHCGFSPRTSLDMELCHFMQQEFKVVSWEAIVAGPGIFDIYRFLRDGQKKEEPGWLTEALQEQKDPSAVISQAALQQKAAICIETMDLYVRYLAYEAANLTLKMKAVGGLFLGGGIPPKIAPLLQEESFYRHYMDCDRMQHLLETVPIRIIKNDKTGLLGAAYYGAFA